MRAHILDTYYGEGQLDTQAADYPGFDGLYFKVSHGNLGYMELNTQVGNVTRQIASTAKDFQTVGIYHYPARNEVVNWRLQADTYLRQCDLLDRAGVTVDYDVLDIERTFILVDGKFPKGHGAAMEQFYQYVVLRTKRPFFIYSDPYAYNECFRFYGYTWQDELPWIAAQYPYRQWVAGLDREAVKGLRSPNLHPVNRPWSMWQYSDKFPAGDWMPDSSAADVNVWNGSIEDMLGFFEKEPEEPPIVVDPKESNMWDLLKELAQKFIELLCGLFGWWGKGGETPPEPPKQVLVPKYIGEMQRKHPGRSGEELGEVVELTALENAFFYAPHVDRAGDFVRNELGNLICVEEGKIFAGAKVQAFRWAFQVDGMNVRETKEGKLIDIKKFSKPE